MAEQYANCTVHHKMHSDRRFDLLGELGGWTRNDASFRMVQLWARCTAMQTDRPPAIEIRAHLGLRGEELLLTSGLGERCSDGAIRVLGGGLTGGDTDRFSWYEPLGARNAAGGLARAEQVRRTGRGPRGRFAPAGASDHQQPHQRATSATSDRPAIGEAPPASGFRISEEDQNSLSRAIPLSVPQPEPTPVPAVSPPAPAREDIAGTQAIAGDQLEASKSGCTPETSSTWTDHRPPDPTSAIRAGETTLRANPPPAPIAFDPTDPFARGRLAELTYQRVSDARITVAAELKLPEPLPFPPITPATRTRGFVELSSRIREEGALAPAACDRVVDHAIRQARAKQTIDWLGERLFGDKAWANARDGIDPSARTGATAAARELAARFGERAAPPPRRTKAEPPPPKAAPADDLIAMAAAARVALGHDRPPPAAALETPALLQLCAEPRAGPDASDSSDRSPDEKPSRKHRTS